MSWLASLHALSGPAGHKEKMQAEEHDAKGDGKYCEGKQTPGHELIGQPGLNLCRVRILRIIENLDSLTDFVGGWHGSEGRFKADNLAGPRPKFARREIDAGTSRIEDPFLKLDNNARGGGGTSLLATLPD